jgi:primosomal protein N' (replication factor Y)
MAWKVALLSPPYLTLSYASSPFFTDDAWGVGQRVVVPLGRSLRCGLIVEREASGGEQGDLKPLLWPLENRPLLCSKYLELVFELAKHHLHSPGHVLSIVLPPVVRRLNLRLAVRDERFSKELKLSELRLLPAKRLELLADLWREGRVEVIRSGDARQDRLMEVQGTPPWPLTGRATRQIEVLDFLWANGPQSSRHLRREFGPQAASALARLKQRGLVTECAPDKETAQERPAGQGHASWLDGLELTREQRAVLPQLEGAVDEQRFAIRLLFGVTGSGKTLIYMHLVRRCLQQGRSALILVPEVALALQVWSAARSCFEDVPCHLYHGYQPDRMREQTFSSLAGDATPCIVVGTRSAVFLPHTRWGLIVLDEEHDASFKQEERLSYHTKEVAFLLGRLSGALLLLGSATPDIKTYHAARQGHFPLLSLEERVGEQRLPETELVNLLQEPAEEGPFAERVHQSLQECLHAGDQAIILLNRRGYAPLVYCTSCGEVVQCERCRVGMTYHKRLERLLCHYCGLSFAFPMSCPQCGGHQYVPLSEGTEQVEEYLRSRLDPCERVLRLDRDSTRRKGSMEAILDAFAREEGRVLVGTQMCSKGHHFPRVTLVVVLDGDVGLNLPDYRATERTFQLLVQVAGRAGRGERPGRVMIQTRNPKHYCWQYVLENDYTGFYAQEIERRRMRGYPPFVKLGLLRLSYPADRPQGKEEISRIASYMQQQAPVLGARVLGPAPAPLSQLKGRLRYQCLIKASDFGSIRSLCAPVLQSRPVGSALRVDLDLDPIHML